MKISAMVAAAGLLAIAGAANAQFSGAWDHSNWTTTLNGGDGSVTNKTATTATVNGTDGTGANVNTDYTIVVPAGSWQVSFAWKYSSVDSGTYDSGGYLVNGNYTVLAFNNTQGSGSTGPLVLNGGDTFGFRVFSADSAFGRGILDITKFEAIPAPGALALLGLGGLVAGRRRR
jgi:hypothetical protein